MEIDVTAEEQIDVLCAVNEIITKYTLNKQYDFYDSYVESLVGFRTKFESIQAEDYKTS